MLLFTNHLYLALIIIFRHENLDFIQPTVQYNNIYIVFLHFIRVLFMETIINSKVIILLFT